MGSIAASPAATSSARFQPRRGAAYDRAVGILNREGHRTFHVGVDHGFRTEPGPQGIAGGRARFRRKGDQADRRQDRRRACDSRCALEENGRDGLPGELFSRAVRRGRPGHALLRDCGRGGLQGVRLERRADLGPHRGGVQPDLRLRHRRAETEMAPAAGHRRDDRLLPADRAGRRQRRRRNCHHVQAGRRRIRHQRQQDLHHQRRPTWAPASSLPPSTARCGTRASAPLSSI